MRMQRAFGWLVLPALLVSACSSRPQERPVSVAPAQTERPSTPTGSQEPVSKPQPPAPPAKELPPEKQPQVKRLAARFHLFTGPLGFKFPDARHELKPGETVVVGLDPFDVDLLLPGVAESVLRQGLKVEGGQLLDEPAWLPAGGLALQIGKGEAGQVVRLRLTLTGAEPAVLTIRRAAPATVTVDQRFGHRWKPITVLDAYTSPGPSAVRLTFSKPVRKAEVEQALLAAQSVPIRGLMEWTDEQTLTWQIAQLPPRLDFLLGGAHDQDGLPLPGGIPSIRLGEPPTLVELDLSNPADGLLGTLPPDIISAQLTRDGKAVNLLAWTPGITKWDWQTVEIYFDLQAKGLKRGRVEDPQPRIPGDLENVVASPNGLFAAGLRSQAAPSASHQADLVVMDMRGGRSQRFPGVIGRFRGGSQVDLSTHLAWSPDSLLVAVLSYAGDAESSDLVTIEPGTGKRTVVLASLPVRSEGTRLSWSNDGRWLLAGNLLVNRESGSFLSLPGPAADATGLWEPGGGRLLYSAQDWGSIALVDPDQGEVKPLGDGLVVGWTAPDRVLLVRWPGSESRYLPPGQ